MLPHSTSRAQRVREVENAILSQTFGGHPPTPAALADMQQYIEGMMSREEGFRQLYSHVQEIPLQVRVVEAPLWAKR